MEWLNYHHLLYFWTVARTGSIAAAGQELRLSAPTISNQLRKLEDSLGEKLFRKAGRGLALTDMGRIAMRYADEIFSLGHEFTDAIKNRPTGRPLRLSVGIADVLPKLIAFRLLQPAYRLKVPLRMVCREDSADRLVADLAVHRLDVVLSDSPVSPGAKIRAFSHLLGECGVSFLATKDHARLRRGFPHSLASAPVLLPTDDTALRRGLDQWFHEQNVRPNVVGEFADFALLRVFAEEGFGVIAAPSILVKQTRRYGLHAVGHTDAIRVRFYAISAERKLQHPGVLAICETAREKVFG